MKITADTFYAAMLARDHRFDGKFFIGVKTTGIYCRPICPAKPKRENVEFFPNANLAERAGYRPCMRCRPECAPQSAAWSGTSAVVQRALRLICENKLREMNEDQFADLFGVTARHLRRLFDEDLGQTPKQISDNIRLDFARQLLVETSLTATDIAYASGFQSIRRFNDSMKKRFHHAPSHLRKNGIGISEDKGIQLRLAYRPPLDWAALTDFFAVHAIDGVEQSINGIYERVFCLNGITGGLRLEAAQDHPELELRIVTKDTRSLLKIVRKVRQMFDLDADPLMIANSFEKSEHLSELVGKYPGLRVPRGWDPYETTITSILGQLVSTSQARRLVGQLVSTYGKKTTNPLSGKDAFLFPKPSVLAVVNMENIGTTEKRKQAIRHISRLIDHGKLSLDSTQDPDLFRRKIHEIPGIGVWTAEYIAMRALGDPDAFPSTDLILKRALNHRPDLNIDEIRPWRSYAATYLWKEYATQLSKNRNNGKQIK